MMSDKVTPYQRFKLEPIEETEEEYREELEEHQLDRYQEEVVDYLLEKQDEQMKKELLEIVSKNNNEKREGLKDLVDRELLYKRESQGMSLDSFPSNASPYGLNFEEAIDEWYDNWSLW